MTHRIEDAVEAASDWTSIHGIEGVGQGETGGSECIVVYASDVEAAKRIPSTFHGFKVVVEQTDPFLAQDAKKDR